MWLKSKVFYGWTGQYFGGDALVEFVLCEVFDECLDRFIEVLFVSEIATIGNAVAIQ